MKPWVSIHNSSRSEYKDKLEDELRLQQLKIKKDREREEAQYFGSFPY